jgi:hypothetical protein
MLHKNILQALLIIPTFATFHGHIIILNLITLKYLNFKYKLKISVETLGFAHVRKLYLMYLAFLLIADAVLHFSVFILYFSWKRSWGGGGG